MNKMPYALLDSIQANKLLLKILNCRSLSLESHISCILMWQSNQTKLHYAQAT